MNENTKQAYENRAAAIAAATENTELVEYAFDEILANLIYYLFSVWQGFGNTPKLKSVKDATKQLRVAYIDLYPGKSVSTCYRMAKLAETTALAIGKEFRETVKGLECRDFGHAVAAIRDCLADGTIAAALIEEKKRTRVGNKTKRIRPEDNEIPASANDGGSIATATRNSVESVKLYLDGMSPEQLSEVRAYIESLFPKALPAPMPEPIKVKRQRKRA